MDKINLTIWNEFIHEKKPEIKAVYPEGIHGAIRSKLEPTGKYNILTCTLDDPDCGLTDEVINNTDVMIWWGHTAHNKVPDDIAEKIFTRVKNGMGIIFLHSSTKSKPFIKLIGGGCRFKWRVAGDRERIWIIEGGHPIARGLPEYIELPEEEMYGEKFDIPTPDELVMISWFSGGEVFRSGCCYYRGNGKIFYFQPGHETYPTFHNYNIARVLENAVDWACPNGGNMPTYGKYESLEG